MSAATDSGEIVHYDVGDVIPNVKSWPTFEQLKRIEWIAAFDEDKKQQHDQVPGAATGLVSPPRRRRR